MGEGNWRSWFTVQPLSINEIERLQEILIEDKRFVFLGLRGEGGFIGLHD